MDTILYNGNIHSLDRAVGNVSAIAIKDGIVIRRGSDEEILALADEKTEKIDLGGRLVLPGFADSHMHLLLTASFMKRVDLSGAVSFEQVKELLKLEAPRAKRAGRWLLGANFNNDDWVDTKKLPDRHDLDAISMDVPIAITRACGHIVCLNTNGMMKTPLWNERAETTTETIDFGEDGLPNGYVRENSGIKIDTGKNEKSVEEYKKMILDVCSRAVEKGITQIHSDDFNLVDPDDWETVIEAYRQMCEEGSLPLRIYEQCRFRDPESFQRFLDKGYRSGDSFGRFTFGPLKLLGDGSLGSHSRAMLEPYKNDPSTKGILLFRDEDLYEMVKMAQINGFSIAVHCIGDATVQQVLDAVDRVSKEYPRANMRHGIVHCQIMTDEQVERFAKLGMIAYIQPVFLRSDTRIVDACVGAEKAKQSYNWRHFQDIGVHQSGGSDCPVEKFDILPNIFYAVSRKPAPNAEPWYPENGLTIDEAVAMFTKEAAYASYCEATRGDLGIGKYADLVVLDKDIYNIPVNDIMRTDVLMTMVEGEIVYKA